ncbi:MAG: PAS domain S-box protein [Longimicrobiales bacterium]
MHELIDGSGAYVQNTLGLAMVVVATLSLGVGIWVVVRERARRISLLLLAASAAIATYVLSFSFLVRTPDPEVAHRWAHVAYFGVPFIVPSLYHFSMELLGLRRERRPLIVAAWVVGLVYMVLAQGTELLIPGVMRTAWGYYAGLTVWNIPFIVWSFLLLGLAIRDYWMQYRHAQAVQRARIRWLAIPLVVASLGFADYVPSLGVALPPLGFAFLAAFPLAAMWVVARYHLPDLTPAFAADQILSTMAEPLLVVDDLGRIAITNPAAARLLGWPEDDLVGMPLPMLLGAGTAGRITAGASVQGWEMEIAARTGEPIAVSVSTNRLVAKGREAGTVIVMRDIRERRRAARQLERREEYFRSLIENARDTITVLDAGGRVLYQSPSHAEVLDRKPGEDLGRSVFERVHPDDRQPMQEMFESLLDEPGGTARAEIRFRRTGGEYRIIDVRAHNLLDHPAVRGVVVNGRDVTEERRLAERLQQSQKLEAIGRLAGGIAHDFNNILTTIQGTVSFMAEELPEESGLAAELDVVRKEAERAGRLTNQLLAFGRRQMTRPETIDLNQLLRDLRSGLQQVLAPEQRLVIRPAPDLGAVRIDRSQLEAALVDLLANARDAMGDEGRLEITTENVDRPADVIDELPIEQRRYVLLTVADDGHGMDATTQQRIFEPFFTTREDAAGEGLGLSTVYGAVRQAGGHIEVESEPGRGARFSIYLPRADEADTEAVPPDGAIESVSTDGRGELVLVVEDEAPVRSLVRKVLERKGYRVLEAADGKAALELAADHHGEIDLLIADLVMPGLSGREVAERLNAAEPDLATILISGYTADEVVREGIEQGEFVFLPKPFSPEILTRRVAEVLRGRQ